MADIYQLNPGALHYLDGLGAPFMFLEEWLVRPPISGSLRVKNFLPKLIFVLEGSLRHQFNPPEATVLRPGSVLVHFEDEDHFYLPLQGQRIGQLRALRLTLPWNFQEIRLPEEDGSVAEKFGVFVGSRLPLRGVVQMPAGAKWGRLMRDLQAALVSRRADRRFRVDALARVAVLQVMQQHQSVSAPGRDLKGESVLLEKIEKFLEDHLHHHLSLAQVAGAMDRTEEHIARLFRRKRGTTIFEELKRMRIERARYFLLCTDLTVTRIAEQSGFLTLAHFSRVFRELTGRSPLQFRVARLEE